MPRFVAWTLRAVVSAVALIVFGYSLLSPLRSPERFGFRIFGLMVLLFVAMVWELTKSDGEDSDSSSDAGDADA